MLLVCVYVYVCISFSVFYGPSMLTNFCSSSDSGFGCLCITSSSGTISRAFSAYPADIRSTHCFFLKCSLLVGFSFQSCSHRFHLCYLYPKFLCRFLLRRCLFGHVFLVVSRITLSRTRTLLLATHLHICLLHIILRCPLAQHHRVAVLDLDGFQSSSPFPAHRPHRLIPQLCRTYCDCHLFHIVD